MSRFAFYLMGFIGLSSVSATAQEARFSALARNIFHTTCLKCHKPPEPKGDVDFTSYGTLMNSQGLDMSPIVPGKPEESGVYLMVAEKQMPPGEAKKLSAGQIAAIYHWIKSGARND